MDSGPRDGGREREGADPAAPLASIVRSEALRAGAAERIAPDPVAPELLADECTDCRLVAALGYVQLYVRRR